MSDQRDEPALDDDQAEGLDAGLHGGLPDDAAEATPGPEEATSADDVDKERSGPS